MATNGLTFDVPKAYNAGELSGFLLGSKAQSVDDTGSSWFKDMEVYIALTTPPPHFA